mmetsp:Transcript_8570/g.8696  ORF Transcript_8570/g.8696 Transcript_8570/m.8696 type:complete len:472 (+) Transcript_8570:71-1486(+)|eukprot:CAMPEP_0182423656 /NCGR_PEP_ID=MMETSP1167-20130531/9732_1 /TAXON_ID=2988 /ORGANISM="Mallomonas Sp, Strain CCMP3275" /LENGTH=471 /DNA_ID=CAMNT_0024602837 /DNA_START=118 /DNA_END=1533 /DNA_ORIENTATION=+
MNKSRFRGVYKCGKRWKAQLQSGGVQFYLGTFDSEAEAAKAYDVKAKEEKGGKAQTNFDEYGNETTVCQMRPPMYHIQSNDMTSNNEQNSNNFYSNNQNQSINHMNNSTNTLSNNNNNYQSNHNQNNNFNTNSKISPSNENVPDGSVIANASEISMLWDKLVKIAYRQRLAEAAKTKLTTLKPDQQSSQSIEEKEMLLNSLSDELALLAVVRQELESAITVIMASALGAQKARGAPVPSSSQVTEQTQELTERVEASLAQLPSHTGAMSGPDLGSGSCSLSHPIHEEEDYSRLLAWDGDQPTYQGQGQTPRHHNNNGQIYSSYHQNESYVYNEQQDVNQNGSGTGEASQIPDPSISPSVSCTHSSYPPDSVNNREASRSSENGISINAMDLSADAGLLSADLDEVLQECGQFLLSTRTHAREQVMTEDEERSREETDGPIPPRKVQKQTHAKQPRVFTFPEDRIASVSGSS